jgi:hypothetical protein
MAGMSDEQSGLPVRRRGVLIGVNIALVAALAGLTLLASRPAEALGQRTATTEPAPARGAARGLYTMLSGRIQGSTTSAIYILDAANQELVALTWNRSAGQLEPIGLRNLSDDARFLQRPR